MKEKGMRQLVQIAQKIHNRPSAFRLTIFQPK